MSRKAKVSTLSAVVAGILFLSVICVGEQTEGRDLVRPSGFATGIILTTFSALGQSCGKILRASFSEVWSEYKTIKHPDIYVV